MKVYLYKVKEHDPANHSLAELLDNVLSAPLPDRIKLIGSKEIRIENISKSPDQYYLIDFVVFRNQHGPGRGSHSQPVQGFTFNDGESFCEQTACLYDPTKGYLTLQYNHHGVRSTAIQDYFSTYLDDPDFSFELLPKYDDDTMRRFNNKVSTKRVEFTVDTRFMTEADRKANVSLNKALSIGDESGGEKISIQISAGLGGKKSLKESALGLIEKLRLKSIDDPDAVKKLKVGIQQNIDGKTELLDLIGHRLCQEFSNMLTGKDLRFPQQDRYDAVAKAYKGWKKLL